MNWQLIVVALSVGLAALYVGRQTWRTWFGSKSGCSGGCGCSKSTPANAPRIIPVDELTLRVRSPS